MKRRDDEDILNSTFKLIFSENEITDEQRKQALLFIDGISFGRAYNLFSWNVPLNIGRHSVSVVCGDENVVSYFNVN